MVACRPATALLTGRGGFYPDNVQKTSRNTFSAGLQRCGLSKSATKARIGPERARRIVGIPRFSSRPIPPRSAFVADLDAPQPRVTTGVPPAPRRRPQNNLPVLYMGKFLLETYVLGIVAKSCGRPRIDPRGRRSPMCNTTARTEKKLPGHCVREPFRQCPRNRPREKPARPYPAESPHHADPSPIPGCGAPGGAFGSTHRMPPAVSA